MVRATHKARSNAQYKKKKGGILLKERAYKNFECYGKKGIHTVFRVFSFMVKT